MQYNIPNVKTFEFTKIIGLDKITFGHDVIIDDFVLIYATASMRFGNHVHIAAFSSITGGAEFEIGDFAGISQGARVLTGSDDFIDWGFGNPTVPEKYRNVIRKPVKIGNFCLVGANSVVLPGTEIGEGAVVGANSIARGYLEPWGIYLAGKKIGNRNKAGVLANFKAFQEQKGN